MPQLKTASAIEFKLPTAVVRRTEELERMNAVAKEPNPANVSEAAPVEPKVIEEPVAPVVQPEPELKSPVNEWEHKFKTLQGMYNADKRRSQGELTEALAKIKALENAVVNAEKAVERKWDIRKYIPADELEKYDEEQLHTVLKATLTAASEEVQDQVKREINPLKEELEAARKTAREVATDAFYTALDVGIPDWKDVNNDPEFHSWLAEPDELSGVERQAALTVAEQRMDAKRVIAIFKAFQKSRVVKPDVRKELERKILPDVSNPTVIDSVAAQQGDVISRRTIREFYDNVRRGRVTRQQQADMERRIQAAISNGRVID